MIINEKTLMFEELSWGEFCSLKQWVLERSEDRPDWLLEFFRIANYQSEREREEAERTIVPRQILLSLLESSEKARDRAERLTAYVVSSVDLTDEAETFSYFFGSDRLETVYMADRWAAIVMEKQSNGEWPNTCRKADKDAKIEDIARTQLGIQSLETKGSDSQDFKEYAVWSLKRALERAFEEGVLAGKGRE